MCAPERSDYERRLVAAAEFVLEKDRREGAAPPPDPKDIGVTAVFKPHQLDGVAWLLRRYELGVNVLLGDEMGLGKTLQAISLLSYLKHHFIIDGPFLVLCPLSVTEGWMSEFSKFCPSLFVVKYVGDKEQRRILRRTIYEQSQKHFPLQHGELKLQFDVLLTTYDIALLDQHFLSQILWRYSVIDEAQRLKNPSSVLYKVLEEKFIMPRRLLMTGTPIQNNLSELWALMHFCLPTVFGTLENFISTFPEARISKTDRATGVAARQFQLLKHILGAFMLRRTKGFLVKSGALLLPPLTEITVLVPLTPLQKKVCMSIMRKELQNLLAISSSNHQSLQNIVIQLRKACSHPYLFPGIEPEPYEEGEHLVQASGKLIVLDLLLQKLNLRGHRVLLFAQMTHTLDILQDFLELRKYTYERLDGSVRAEERFAAIRNFSKQQEPDKHQTSSSAVFVFMISTRAGGVGLNLVAADTVIFYEQDWNPQVDKQALQRAHRIGQMNHVLSINLVSEHSIEEVIMRRAETKLSLSNNVIGDDTCIHELGTDKRSEAGDMRSLILGLQVYDLVDLNNGNIGEKSITELSAMTDKVVEIRSDQFSDKDDRRFEITPKDVMGGTIGVKSYRYVGSDLKLDEDSYLSWVEKFKEASESSKNTNVDLGRRNTLEEARQKRENDKKNMDKKLSKWAALGYKSLAVMDPYPVDNDIIGLTDRGSVQFVYGDCTKPQRKFPSEAAIIFSCVDTSGKWGHGGLFDALAKLSMIIPDSYARAFECGDLHMGDLHLINFTDSSVDGNVTGPSTWAALAVVQSYNPRRKVPRSGISNPDLDRCLAKVSFSASQLSASVHVPRIGYKGGSQRSEWYVVERLLKKYASVYGINFLVYYFRRPSTDSNP